MEVLASFIGKKKATRSLPHHENVHQWSVDDLGPSIMVYQSVLWLFKSIYSVSAIFVV